MQDFFPKKEHSIKRKTKRNMNLSSLLKYAALESKGLKIVAFGHLSNSHLTFETTSDLSLYRNQKKVKLI